MNNFFRLTIMVENKALSYNLLAEHGLAYMLETNNQKIMMDTGQGASNVLEHNLKTLSLTLDNVNSLFLSHGHYDHCGKIDKVLEASPNCAVYAHPDIFTNKITRSKDVRNIGISKKNIDLLKNDECKLILSKKSLNLGDGIRTTGEIPRNNDFEDTGGDFFHDKELTIRDQLLDDQALFFSTIKGTVIILGCAHAGVVNTIERVYQLTNGKQIFAIIGGMHLLRASELRLQKTVVALKKYSVKRLYPMHCTGWLAERFLYNSLPGKVFSCGVGSVLEF